VELYLRSPNASSWPGTYISTQKLPLTFTSNDVTFKVVTINVSGYSDVQ